MPTETSEAQETPLQTAMACVDTEVAAYEGSLQVKIAPEPIFSKTVTADSGRVKSKKRIEELGMPEWVEIETLYKLLCQRGRPFHRIALLKSMEFLAVKREVFDRYSGFLRQLPQLLDEEVNGPYCHNGGWVSG